MLRSRLAVFGGFALLGLLASAVGADPLDPEDVPPPLAPWVDWVLRGHEAERCSLLSGPDQPRVCAWPTRLSLTLGESSGRFRQAWEVERRMAVPLPGDVRHWPQDVTVDGRPAPVTTVGGRPGVRLEPGRHDVGGRFYWDALPEGIQIPPQTALLDLSLEGPGGTQAIPSPKRDGQGRLWLRQQRAGGDDDESRLEILVHRRVIDDVPMRLETRVEFEVSGRSRELVLGRALPEGFVPMSLESPLPARLDPDGCLRVQVRPGRFPLTIAARREARGPRLAWTDPGGPWAPSEVWVFQALPDLRIVTVSGATPVDPQQTKLPPDWRNLPAYLVKPGDALEIVEKRRGDADPAPDALTLTRSLWLDFDGGGYTVQDRIQGEIRRSSRLDMGAGTQLGRVALDGRDQFITSRPGAEGLVGVEVPRGAIDVTADSRIEEAGSAIPAVGWNQDFQSLAARLQLPPGWQLLHASGVDRADSTWLNRWNLLDLFMALIIALAFGRLWGPLWGGVAALGIALTYTEPGAPQWTWLAVLIGEALARALPEGRFAGWISVYRAVAVASLILVALPFAVGQARIGLHPALERPRAQPVVQTLVAQDGMTEEEATGSPPPAPPVPARKRAATTRPGAPSAMEGRLSGRVYDYEPDPGARITTGPGLPAWQWRDIALSWNGPVTRAQHLDLVLLPPWLSGIVAFGRVGLLAALGVCVLLLGTSGPGWVPRSALLSRAVMVLVAFSLVAPVASRAETPPPELLEELRTRLLAPPSCAPKCATARRLELRIRGDRLVATFEVDALAETGAPLPGGARSWLPDEVVIEGAAAPALRGAADGVLWARLAPGVHRVRLAGRLPARDRVELPLPLRPHRVEADLRGWTLQGVLEDGRPEGTLQLVRIAGAAPKSRAEIEPGDPQTLPAFVEIVRRIRLGLTWQVSTVVRRLTPSAPALRLDLPLLPGEAITTAGIRAADGRVRIALDPGVPQVEWQSTLAASEELVLAAEESGASREVWHLDASPLWHVEFEGIPVVHQPTPTRARVRQWRPWPGERVVLSISRPEGVEGRTATFDATRLVVRPGLRATDATLTASLRSSRGGEHRVTLPEGAEVQRVSIDGVARPIRQEAGGVTLPLVPGAQTIELVWREPRGVALTTPTSRLDLGMESVNAALEIAMPRGRWILATGGPSLGPAVLFWSYAAVLVALAFALGRVPWTPLRFHHWLLLGLGLTQAPLAAAVVVVAWLLALGARREHGTRLPGRWLDLVQVGLVLLTVWALVSLIFSIETGLLGLPEMQIEGNGSSADHLRWYQDRAGPVLPSAWVFSLPLLVYRLAMLAWALWLAQALLRWLRWGWACFSHGELWRPLRTPKAAPGS